MEAQWPIGYGVGLRIKRSSVRIRPWPLRWVLGQGSLLPLSQGEAFTLASISYLAILVKYIVAKKKKKKKKVETLINKFNYLLQVRKTGVLYVSVGKKKKTDGSTGDHSIDLNPGLPLLHFVAAFFNLILYDFVQSFFHIFVPAVKCSLPFLELCFILTFSNFHAHFLFGHEKKKKNTWDLHGHPSPIVKIYFQNQNHNKAKVDLTWRLV